MLSCGGDVQSLLYFSFKGIKNYNVTFLKSQNTSLPHNLINQSIKQNKSIKYHNYRNTVIKRLQKGTKIALIHKSTNVI